METLRHVVCGLFLPALHAIQHVHINQAISPTTANQHNPSLSSPSSSKYTQVEVICLSIDCSIFGHAPPQLPLTDVYARLHTESASPARRRRTPGRRKRYISGVHFYCFTVKGFGQRTHPPGLHCSLLALVSGCIIILQWQHTCFYTPMYTYPKRTYLEYIILHTWHTHIHTWHTHTHTHTHK